MTDWPLVLALTKLATGFAASISWPVAAGAIAYTFRKPISSAIGKARSVSAFGVSVDLPVQPQDLDKLGPSGLAPTVAARELSVTPIPPSDETLDPIDAYLSGLLEKEPLDDRQRYQWAIRLASAQALTAEYERVYRLSYGSQLRFLKQLNVSGRTTLAYAMQFFATHSAPDFEDATYTFEPWLNFLTRSLFVNELNEAGATFLELTARGRGFLTWMIAHRASEDKPL